jgi:predicted DCC family thiol-disulfide oxidoreductase YuxK
MGKKAILLFDGVCNLCNRSVQFIIKRDQKKRFLYAPLQGKTGQELLQRFNLPADDFNSFVLVEDEKVFSRSSAALRVLKKLGRGWQLLYVFIIVPPFIRNAVYDLIARNRYKWFGRKDSCMIPTKELRERFLE